MHAKATRVVPAVNVEDRFVRPCRHLVSEFDAAATVFLFNFVYTGRGKQPGNEQDQILRHDLGQAAGIKIYKSDATVEKLDPAYPDRWFVGGEIGVGDDRAFQA